MDAGGTSPWMGEGRIMQEQLSRATQDAKAELVPTAILEFQRLLPNLIREEGNHTVLGVIP